MSFSREYDVVIVGAGPAGLAAAHCLNERGLKYAIIEAGRGIELRNKDNEESLTEGHGGAGLYSDGKFSFFPSASALWGLKNERHLKAAYEWVDFLLSKYGLKVPPFPENPNSYSIENGKWILKEYPSSYISLDGRIDMINYLSNGLKGDVYNEATVKSVVAIQNSGYEIDLSNEIKIYGKKIILATGRFGPLSKIFKQTKSVLHRLEIGFRIEQPAEKSFFSKINQLDPKLRFASDNGSVEWRTFCACREGDTVYTKTRDLWTVSGHSDCKPSGRSNVGFNTRILDENIATLAMKHVIKSIEDPESYFEVSASEFIMQDGQEYKKLRSVFGEHLVDHMREGIRLLAEKYSSIYDAETKLIGPTVEGIGWYPELNLDLSVVGHENLLIAGDACGLFRGIIAAFVSGHYVGNSVNNNPNFKD